MMKMSDYLRLIIVVSFGAFLTHKSEMYCVMVMAVTAVLLFIWVLFFEQKREAS